MNEKHLQTIRGAIGEKFYWNFYCDFFSMASSKGSNKEHFLDEKRWLKYVETAAVAIDLMIVADQTKENRAAHEFHLDADSSPHDFLVDFFAHLLNGFVDLQDRL